MCFKFELILISKVIILMLVKLGNVPLNSI